MLVHLWFQVNAPRDTYNKHIRTYMRDIETTSHVAALGPCPPRAPAQQYPLAYFAATLLGQGLEQLEKKEV